MRPASVVAAQYYDDLLIWAYGTGLRPEVAAIATALVMGSDDARRVAGCWILALKFEENYALDELEGLPPPRAGEQGWVAQVLRGVEADLLRRTGFRIPRETTVHRIIEAGERRRSVLFALLWRDLHELRSAEEWRALSERAVRDMATAIVCPFFA